MNGSSRKRSRTLARSSALRAVLWGAVLLLASCASDAELARTPVHRGPLGDCYRKDKEADPEAAFAHAKALVEASVARICGREVGVRVDSFEDELYVAELVERASGARRKIYVSAPPSLWTWKYLFDHVGEDHDSIPEELSREADAIIQPYLKTGKKLEETREKLRDFDARLAQALGVELQELVAKESELDTALGTLGGYTLLPYLPAFDESVIHLPPLGSRGAWSDLSTYGHEVMHALVAEESGYEGSILSSVFDGSDAPEKNYVEEAWCQVFGELVAEELQAQGLLSASPRRRRRGAGASARRVARTSDGLQVVIKSRREILEERLDRLAALYHDPTLRFPSILRTQGRYGYMKGARRTERRAQKAAPVTAPKKKARTHFAAAMIGGTGELDIDLEAVFRELVIYMNPLEIAAVIPDMRKPDDALALRDHARECAWLDRERAREFLRSLR